VSRLQYEVQVEKILKYEQNSRSNAYHCRREPADFRQLQIQ